MTALPVLDRPDTRVPKIAAVSDSQSTPPVGDECSSAQILELNPDDGAYPVPKVQRPAKQAPGNLKRAQVRKAHSHS